MFKSLKSKLLRFFLASVLGGECLAQSLPPLPPIPAGRIYDAWLFQDTNWTSLMGDAPLSFTDLFQTSDWAGNGLLIDSTNSAFLNYAIVETNGATNINFAEGTVEVWFSPDWNTSDGIGNWGTLLEAGSWNTNLSAATGAIGLYISPDGSTINWSAQTNGYSTNYLSAPINWNAGDFHHIAVTYSATNSALYLEGQLVTNGPGISVLPSTSVLTNGFSIGSDGNATGLQQARGIFNQLVTYDYILDAETISNYFAYDSQNVYPLPSSGHFTLDEGPPSPGGGGTNGGGGGGIINYAPVYGSNDFWIEALPLGTNSYNSDTNSITLLLHGTIANTAYQILSTTNLQGYSTVWGVEQNLTSAGATNLTPSTVSMSGRPALFFKALAYGLDSDGDGLPDWWENLYGLSPTNSDTGNTGIPDGYKQDSAGDGYNNLQKYAMGVAPNVFVQPAAPTGFVVSMDTNYVVHLSWNQAFDLPTSGAGAVTGYTLTPGETYSLSASTTNYTLTTNNCASLAYDLSTLGEIYGPYVSSITLQINYANTNSATTAPFLLTNPADDVRVAMARGQQDKLFLLVSAVGSNVSAIRLLINSGVYSNIWEYPVIEYGLESEIESYTIGYSPSSILDIPISSFTNGIYEVPSNSVPLYQNYQFLTQGISINGRIGPFNLLNVFHNEYSDFVPFLDGRSQIQQNVKFLLRGALADSPFAYSIGSISYATSNDYVASGLFTDDVYNNFLFSEFQPFDDDYLFRNWGYSAVDFTNGGFQTDLNYYAIEPYNFVYNNPKYLLSQASYATGALTAPIPEQLSNSTQWILFGVMADSSSEANYDSLAAGIASTGSTYTIMNCTNIFGLPLNSILCITNDSGAGNIATPGQTFNLPGSFLTFFAFDEPALTNSAFYFARPGLDPIPGDPVFSITNSSPASMILPFGQPSFLTAWCKQSILNGASGKFAYAEDTMTKPFLLILMET